jgi:hypothetical protein
LVKFGIPVSFVTENSWQVHAQATAEPAAVAINGGVGCWLMDERAKLRNSARLTISALKVA